MPDLQGNGFDLVVLLAFLFVGWYLVGGLWQRRRTAEYVRALGALTTDLAAGAVVPRFIRLGQAGFQLVVDEPVSPFKKLSVVVLLAPREALALWLYSLIRRRGDTVVLRADLRQVPTHVPTPAAAVPGVLEVARSRESPNLVLTLDPQSVRTRPAAEIAQAVRLAATSAG